MIILDTIDYSVKNYHCIEPFTLHQSNLILHIALLTFLKVIPDK